MEGSDDREKIEIYVSCKQLKSHSSECHSVVRCQLQEQGNWKLIGQTEVAPDNLDPTFSIPFTLDFIFEIQQPILFEVLDVTNKNSAQIIGTVQTTVGSVMGARRQTSTYDIKLKDAKVGQLVTQGEKAGKGSGTIAWRWRGINLLNTDGNRGMSDPLLRFFKIRKSGDVLKVHETEAINDTLNPTWNPFDIAIDRLTYDQSKPFKIECWDWEKAGKYQFIGECQATIEQIKNGTTEFELKHPSAPGCTGVVKVEILSKEVKSTSQAEPTFIDYIRGGVQLNAVVAIDFTGSNGDPQYSYSLHHMSPKGDLNDYQKAIVSVCQIVLSYDFDQLIPVYGFGAKPHYETMNSNTVSHCFPCTGSSEQHEVMGVQGIMDVYSYALKNVEFAGPTYFAPLLKEAMKVGQLHKDKDDDVYSIFLILTDGAIHDMDATVDAVIACSNLPLSVIIVGIGKADFSNMVTLDGDQGLTDSHGKKASRDVVQFVPFADFNGDMTKLAQHVLAEIPDQLVQYMKIAGKKPKPPQTN